MSKEDRPWGSFEVIAEGPGNKVKIIYINPGHRLSYQYHEHRTEDWFIVSGQATITLDDDIKILDTRQRIHIPCKAKHRIANMSNTLLTIVEIQKGDLLIEEDITRIEDDYGRSSDEDRAVQSDFKES